MKENTPEIWDNVWNTHFNKEQERYNFFKEKNSIHWKRMRDAILKRYGKIKGLKSIEIGAGSGMYSLLLASEGAKVTVLDYSEKAIKISREIFEMHNLKADFLKVDAFNLSKKFKKCYDLSMSFGTAEHFSGEKRINFIKIHLDVLKRGGMSFICVPNKWNGPYRAHKFLSQSFNRWNFGEEYPFSREEFREIGKILNFTPDFIGKSIFFDPFLLKKRIKDTLKIKEDLNIEKINKQRGTRLDKYLSQYITAIIKKEK